MLSTRPMRDRQCTSVTGRLKPCRLSVARAGYSCAFAILLSLCGSKVLQNRGSPRANRARFPCTTSTPAKTSPSPISATASTMAALEKLNWFLRDCRRAAKQTRMDPHLIDLCGSATRSRHSEPIQSRVRLPFAANQTPCAAPQLGRARFSQHMLGHAMDFYIRRHYRWSNCALSACGLQRGRVGFYPEVRLSLRAYGHRWRPQCGRA